MLIRQFYVDTFLQMYDFIAATKLDWEHQTYISPSGIQCFKLETWVSQVYLRTNDLQQNF